MGQATSTHGFSPGGSNRYHDPGLDLPHHHHHHHCATVANLAVNRQQLDYTAKIPNECLALIFQSLSSGDRNRCSLVCSRWSSVEGQSHHRLALNATAQVAPHLDSIFTRFNSVTKLALRCDRKSISINDDALTLISLRCRNLTRLKL